MWLQRFNVIVEIYVLCAKTKYLAILRQTLCDIMY